MGVVGSVIWGDLDFRCLGDGCLWVGDRVEGVVMSWESLVLTLG